MAFSRIQTSYVAAFCAQAVKAICRQQPRHHLACSLASCKFLLGDLGRDRFNLDGVNRCTFQSASSANGSTVSNEDAGAAQTYRRCCAASFVPTD
jgi:hypothetical protein